MKPVLSIIIPAYNEEKRIGKTLFAIADFLKFNKINFEIIVITNNCTDDTFGLVNKIKNESIPEIYIIDIPKDGAPGYTKGLAIKEGMKKATGKYHLFIDADNATSFEQVLPFMEHIDKGYDVVIGSRYIKGSCFVKKQPLYRVIISRLGNILVRAVLLPYIHDTHCGFKMFSFDASNNIFPKMTLSGWGFDLEIITIATVLNYKIKEAPVRWQSQDGSHLKLNAFLKTFKEIAIIRRNVLKKIYLKKI